MMPADQPPAGLEAARERKEQKDRAILLALDLVDLGYGEVCIELLEALLRSIDPPAGEQLKIRDE